MRTTKDQREKILRNTANPDELWTIDGKLPLSDLIDDLDTLEQKLEIACEALNWVGSIKVAPKESWPSLEVCAQVCNDALTKADKIEGRT